VIAALRAKDKTMGKMQQTLCKLLQDVGTVTKGLLDYPSRRQVAASSYAEEVQRIYRRLGGVLSSFPLFKEDVVPIFLLKT
jgi:hypothetical protein